MPPKYHIATSQSPNRFQKITRSGIIAWEEGCLKCARCVKKDCVYQVYEKRNLDNRQMLDSLDSVCMDCFRCVQNCPNRLIHKGLNPSYKVLGDHYWTPEIISNLWFQAESGRIPVSGAGYGGPFSGPGFDAMWTDMSEIVRPTRDGIHGREYISTTVDIGRKVVALELGPDGDITSSAPPLVEIPLPVIFDMLPWSPPGDNIPLSFLYGARALGTFAIVRQSGLNPVIREFLPHAIIYVDGNPDDLGAQLLGSVRIIEIPNGEDAITLQNRFKSINPELIVIIRLRLGSKTPEQALALTAQGAEALHCVADEYGLEEGSDPLFIKERMKEVHLHLVDKGVRDQITLIGGGGVAMAEHMAKLIICGADALTIDIPLLVAMECRVCRRCKEGITCPVELDSVDPLWGSVRITNLMAGWHSQLLEILGAMGIREVRRLRGEMGRAMFFEDLERETFSAMGKRG
ncbi:MAG: glutamate synthase-related protein [Syntrophorhabdaceae bacterium]|nr:glutamate synthase-related protein [Syntrophorhabdaceae bacterium]MDD5243770.1 glutamate synthase-related protein [Syntrophorhabdaceae bacterium]